MGSKLQLSLLLTSLFITVYAKNPITDHIFVFTGEELVIDCARGPENVDPILMYRQKLDDEPTVYFVGLKSRPISPKNMNATMQHNDYYYSFANAQPDNAGEYECDWTKLLDETNHYVNIIDKASLSCPSFSNPVTSDTVLEGLACAINKSGPLAPGWLNNKTVEMGLDFQVVGVDGLPLDVSYVETETQLIANVVDLKLTREQHNGILRCSFRSLAGTQQTCESNAADVQWPAAGLEVEADDFVESGSDIQIKCDISDVGNPAISVQLKIGDEIQNGTAVTVTATQDIGEKIEVECSAGALTETRSITITSGPDGVTATESKITVDEGDKMMFGCDAGDVKPEAEMVYQIDDQVIMPNATAEAKFNGKNIVCTATNTLSKKSAQSTIGLEVKYKPLAKGKSSESLEAKLDTEAVLNCAIDAHPMPTYAWKFTSTSGPGNVSTETESQLVISKFSASDVGTYICTATNELGSAQKSFDLAEKEEEPGSPAAIVVPIIIVLIIIIAVIVAILLMKRRRDKEQANKDGDLKSPEEGELLPDPNARKDASVPIQVEDDADDDEDDKKKVILKLKITK